MDLGDLKQEEDDSDQFRCSSTLHAISRIHDGVRRLEAKCHHPRCTKGRTVDVYHYFSLETGALVDTVEFKSVERKFHGTR